MKDLPIEIRDGIDQLFIIAFNALKNGDNEEAILKSEEAWYKFPEPKYDWDVTLSFTTGICSLYREVGFYAKAHNIIDELLSSGHLDDYDDGPLFLKGSIYFEQGDLEQAKEWFDKANVISKGRCFVSQPKKYKIFFDEQK